jgi:hypothetical protein
MQKYYTEAQIQSVIRRMVGKHTKAETARKLKVSPQMIVDALSGHCIGPTLLEKIGFEKAGYLYKRSAK